LETEVIRCFNKIPSTTHQDFHYNLLAERAKLRCQDLRAVPKHKANLKAY